MSLLINAITHMILKFINCGLIFDRSEIIRRELEISGIENV